MLGPYASAVTARTACEEWRDKIEDGLGRRLRMRMADPPFDVPESIEDTCFWVRPIAPKDDNREITAEADPYVHHGRLVVRDKV